jgi:hypothetical protein
LEEGSKMKKEQKLQLLEVAKKLAKENIKDGLFGANVYRIPLNVGDVYVERDLLIVEKFGEKGETVSVDFSFVSEKWMLINTSEIVTYVEEILKGELGKEVKAFKKVEESRKELSVGLVFDEGMIIVRNAYKSGIALSILLADIVKTEEKAIPVPVYKFRYFHNEKELALRIKEELLKLDDILGAWDKIKETPVEEVKDILAENLLPLKIVNRKKDEIEIVKVGEQLLEKALKAGTLKDALAFVLNNALEISRRQTWKRKMDKTIVEIVSKVTKQQKVVFI